MSAVPVKDTFTKDPAAVAPTTMATEASSDPIRPTGTDALVPESRPEVTSATEPAHAVAGAPASVSAPTEQKAGENALKVEAEPISEGVLGYKAPGLIKWVVRNMIGKQLLSKARLIDETEVFVSPRNFSGLVMRQSKRKHFPPTFEKRNPQLHTITLPMRPRVVKAFFFSRSVLRTSLILPVF